MVFVWISNIKDGDFFNLQKHSSDIYLRVAFLKSHTEFKLGLFWRILGRRSPVPGGDTHGTNT